MHKYYHQSSFKLRHYLVGCNLHGCIALGALFLLMFVFVCPAVSLDSSATSAEEINARSSAITYEPSTVSVALSAGEITLDSDAGVTGRNTFYSGDETLTVATSSPNGYAIYLSTAEEQSAMQNTNASLTSTIKPLAGSVTPSSFPANSWGYALSTSAITPETPYHPVPAQMEMATPILKQPSGTNGQTYYLSFGTMIDNSLPAGQYRSTVMVSVIANPSIIYGTIGDLTYMQEMTPEVCANTPTPTTGTGVAVNSWKLTDIRDGKQYQVAKLKDGNCWMQENLGLTLSSSKPLTPEDSDLGNVTQLGGTTYDHNYTWTPPDTLMSATNNSDSNGMASWHPNAYWYYQFNAATAGTGNTAYVSVDGTKTQGSVCPKGWRLPVNGEYTNLLQASYSASNNDSVLLQQPLNFVRSGIVYEGRLNVGGNTHYWSATTQSSSTAYNLYFGSSLLRPSNVSDRRHGFNVRCLARTN